MEFSTNTVSRGDYEPITVPISLNIFYLPIKQTKWIRHKLNKLMKSSPNYNMLQ